VATYVVEMYVSRARGGERSKLDRRARAAAESVSAEGVPVLYVRSVFLPEDEICLHFFDAPSREAVEEVARRAALAYERLVEATERSDVAPGRLDEGGTQ
jgi:hypothetical protein